MSSSLVEAKRLDRSASPDVNAGIVIGAIPLYISVAWFRDAGRSEYGSGCVRGRGDEAVNAVR